MKNKRKSIKSKVILGCAVVILGLIAYRIGYIYIWGVHIAERELSKYAKESLNLQEEIDCEYDWYNDRYVASNDLGFTLDYRRQTNTIHDESFSQKESEKARKDYNALIANMPHHLTLPKSITVWTEISADHYHTKAQRLYLLGVYNNEELSEADSFSMPAKIVMDVVAQLGQSYNFTGIQAIYYDQNGMYEIAFPADSFEELTFEKLSRHTKRTEKDEYPEYYLNWLAENNLS